MPGSVRGRHLPDRVEAIDDLRGMAIFLMFCANFITLLSRETPAALRHAQSTGLLPFDFVAPLFGFAMGLSLPFTYHRSGHFSARVVRRVVGLFLIGYIPNLIERLWAGRNLLAAITGTWGILETWALAYGLAALLMVLPPRLRLLSACGSLIFYQLICLNSPAALSLIRAMREGGPYAALAWLFLPVAATIVTDMYLACRPGVFLRRCLVACGLLLIFAFALYTAGAGVDRLVVTPTYILLGGLVSLACFASLEWVSPRFPGSVRRIGRNPLVGWIMQGLVYVPVYLTLGRQYFDWPVGGLVAAGAVVSVWLLTDFLLKKGFTVKM